MSALANRPFLKMNGLGNEIVVLDLRGTAVAVSAAEARAIASAHPYDQMMVLHDGAGDLDAFMRIYNRDGSEVSSCGNGTRCVAWVLAAETGRNTVRLATSSGPLEAMVEGALSVTVDMGQPRFGWADIPLATPVDDTAAVPVTHGFAGLPGSATMVNVGNPHAVFWVDDLAAVDLAEAGPALERHALFPERANISLARVTSRDAMTLRVWERGAGLTRACGTAACAAAVAGARTGRTARRVTVTLPGGDLVIHWRADDHILMTGPVEHDYAATFDPGIFAEAAA